MSKQNAAGAAPRENKMGVLPVGKLLAGMAVPMMISMLVQALYNVVDSIYVSQVSESAVPALSLAFPIQNLLIGFAVGIGVGAVLVAAVLKIVFQRSLSQILMLFYMLLFALSLLLAVGSAFIWDFEVTGNDTVPTDSE